MPIHTKRLLDAYDKLDFHNDGRSAIDAERFRAFQLLITRRLTSWGLSAVNWEADNTTPRCIHGFLESWGDKFWPSHQAQRGHLKMTRITGVRVNERAHLIGYDGRKVCSNGNLFRGTKCWRLVKCAMADSTIGVYLRKFIKVLLECSLPADGNFTDEELRARVLRPAVSGVGGAAGGGAGGIGSGTGVDDGNSSSSSMSAGIGGGNRMGKAKTQLQAQTQARAQIPTQIPTQPQGQPEAQTQALPQTLPQAAAQTQLQPQAQAQSQNPSLNLTHNPDPYAAAIAQAYHQANEAPKSPDGTFILTEHPPVMPDPGPDPPADFPWWMYVALGDETFGDGSKFDGVAKPVV